MAEYLIEWTIEVEADSPEAAAREALKIQRDPSSTSTVFGVTGANPGDTITIDLYEIDEKHRSGSCPDCGSTCWQDDPEGSGQFCESCGHNPTERARAEALENEMFERNTCPECHVVGGHSPDCPTETPLSLIPYRNLRHRCEHVWHDNPALIIPCPECGEGEEPDDEKPRIEFLEGLPNVNYIRQYVHYVFVVKIDGRYKLTLTPPVIPR